MSPEEATDGAAERHEFRRFDSVDTILGQQYRAVCWCDEWTRGPYSTRAAARHAHEEHQQRQLNLAAVQRSYTPRLHP